MRADHREAPAFCCIVYYEYMYICCCVLVCDMLNLYTANNLSPYRKRIHWRDVNVTIVAYRPVAARNHYRMNIVTVAHVYYEIISRHFGGQIFE